MILIYSTFADKDSAAKMAEILLGEKLIACANILPSHIAIYEWEGVVNHDEEIIALFKTTERNWETARDVIAANHSYDTPCILKIPVADGAPEFLQWVEDVTA
jgi:periplasmic divalent cation tolerance protein